MSNDIKFLDYREYIYIEGGPKWKNDCSGRADIALMMPMASIFLYPDGQGPCEYVRTTCTWKSPVYGTTHTVFHFVRRAEQSYEEAVKAAKKAGWSMKETYSGRQKCGV